MIPKIIHYCWFGRREKPELVQRCIASWHQYMPDWQYMEWNEDTVEAYCLEHNLQSPIFNLQYCAEAYEAKKYAFVSDYVRLWALEQFGGVYLDTDVEVVRPLEELEEFKIADCRLEIADCKSKIEAFMGFEESLAHLPGTCVMGCEAHCQWAKDMLALYDDLRFKIEDCRFKSDDCIYDMTTNVQRMGKRMVEGGLVPNGKEQLVNTWNLHVYPFQYFSPITSTRVMRKTKNTFTIHHFAGSWSEKKGKSEVSCQLSDIMNWTITREVVNALIQIKRLIIGQR